MKFRFKNISLYWKFQLIGWTIFILLIYTYQFLTFTESPPAFFATDISAFIIGLLFTHLLKLIIQALSVFRKRFRFQVFHFAVLTILISTLATYSWMIIRISIDGLKLPQQYGREIDFLNASFAYQLWALGTFIGWLVIYILFHYVKGEEERLKMQLQMVELEAKALRAQMNPHFIFNCMNSIKSLIQQHEEEKSVSYLTTFSKLIRTLFNNADKKEISLFDEIETCKLYLQLEAMRFDSKFSYGVNVDGGLDLKSFQIPALIIQPFIENAIWHGIVPKGEGGHVELSVLQKNNSIEIVIDDNGIGREASRQNKPASSLMHQSKGVNLTQSRLELDNLLRQRQAKLEMVDKKDVNGSATGTKVIITLNEEAS